MTSSPGPAQDRSEAEARAEFRILTTEAGQDLLAEAAEVPTPMPSDLARWRKGHQAVEVAAALRIAATRRRAASKFSRADRLWLDPIRLEQATSEPVARHKARRCVEAGVELAVDLCAGVGGDAIALAEAGLRVLAVERDDATALRLRWNAEACEVIDRLLPIRSDAQRFPIPDGAVVHVDPDRRAVGGPRAKRLDGYRPGLSFLRGLADRADGVAIKLGPASDFAEAFGGPGWEIELVSLDGECKEATARAGILATCRRRATSLPTGATWTDRDGPLDAFAPMASGPLAFLHDPDPALIRAGLLDGFAVAGGLERLVEGVDLLTSDRPSASPWLADFAVEEVLPLDLKRLRSEVAARGLGPLEIKVRGLRVRPEDLRAKLRPTGPRPATLILVGQRGPALAILASRVGPFRL